MKNQYISAEIDVIQLASVDVITASDPFNPVVPDGDELLDSFSNITSTFTWKK